MSTIEKIARYSDEKIELYKKEWIINGCGGKGSFKFDKIISFVIDFLQKREGYDAEKGKKLKRDINRVCAEHDIDYFLHIWFFKSNFIFAKNIFLLCKNWTSFVEKSFLFIIIFFWLNIFWLKYYLK